MIWEGIQIKLERKPRRRSLSILIKPNGLVVVRAAVSVKDQQITQFLDLKKTWIFKHLEKFASDIKENPPKEIRHSETFLFLGLDLTLRFVPTPLKTAFFSRTDVHLNLHLPENIWKDISEEELQSYWNSLSKFYEREAKKMISERVHVWSHEMGLFPKKLGFRNQKTRWGSCSSKGTITLNWRLIAAPLEVIDYLIIHELAHLEHMNHSQKFWVLVEKHCPSFRAQETWLKTHQSKLDFLQK